MNIEDKIDKYLTEKPRTVIAKKKVLVSMKVYAGKTTPTVWYRKNKTDKEKQYVITNPEEANMNKTQMATMYSDGTATVE